MLTEAAATDIFNQLRGIIHDSIKFSHSISHLTEYERVSKELHLTQFIANLKPKAIPKSTYYYKLFLLGTQRRNNHLSGISYRKNYVYFYDLKDIIKMYIKKFQPDQLFSNQPLSNYCDFRSGSVWNDKKSRNDDCHQLFISIYADEIKLVNALGAARHINKYWLIYG